MTRAESYQEGRAEGERWAEQDVHERMHDISDWLQTFRQDARGALERRQLSDASDRFAAYMIGVARGYRQVAL